MSTLTIRLPAPAMAREATARMAEAAPTDPYPIPEFYAELIEAKVQGYEVPLTHLEYLLARFGDYSIAQCS